MVELLWHSVAEWPNLSHIQQLPQNVKFLLFLFCWSLSEIFDQFCTFIFEVESVISLISAIAWSSLYTSATYFFSINRL